MTFSIARERYTPLLSSALNFDGIVSRFLASRVCSKVPVKAKAHVRRGGGVGQSIPGGGVGGAPPPGNGFAHAKYPTSSHSATQNPQSVPLRRTYAANWLICRGFAAGRICRLECSR